MCQGQTSKDFGGNEIIFMLESTDWRRGRVVERTSLLKRQGVKALEGSNPSGSAVAARMVEIYGGLDEWFKSTVY